MRLSVLCASLRVRTSVSLCCFFDSLHYMWKGLYDSSSLSLSLPNKKCVCHKKAEASRRKATSIHRTHSVPYSSEWHWTGLAVADPGWPSVLTLFLLWDLLCWLEICPLPWVCCGWKRSNFFFHLHPRQYWTGYRLRQGNKHAICTCFTYNSALLLL